ncbi:MAG: hypothetical protein RLZZ11_1673, partial [Cyanobacteriota bacterium]
DWRLQLWLSEGEPEGLASFDDLEDPEEKESERRPAKAPVRRGEPTAEDLAALDATDWPPLVREIAELRDRMAGMGSVNLVAVEEYSSLRERHDFLTKQSDDLWKAKEELTKAIDELNQTSLKLFTDTFEQVRKNFQFTFERLFVGGKADLQLVQGEDVLESGIEIIAQPPGTKLRGISLLSNSVFGGTEAYVKLYRFYVQEERDPLVQAASIEALGRHGTTEDATLIAERLDSSFFQVRLAAAAALQRLHNERVAEAMWRRLVAEQEESDIRVELAIGLGQYPRDDVFQALATALDQSELAVNLASLDSLAKAPGMGPGLARVVWDYFHPQDPEVELENEQPLELAG